MRIEVVRAGKYRADPRWLHLADVCVRCIVCMDHRTPKRELPMSMNERNPEVREHPISPENFCEGAGMCFDVF